MTYLEKLKIHYKPEKGWINDPNGLVYFDEYYHIFYQYSPNYEIPWKEPMHWGHARTKDFLKWEELPVALYPDKDYDNGGCWSGTAIVKDDTLYLFYASIHTPEGTDEKIASVSVAYSKDGINFEKYEKNPVIKTYPEDGSNEFRDPALVCIDGKYYCIMATGHVESRQARLLKYESDDLFNWEYTGIMCSWDNCKYAECPSFMNAGDKYLLTSSVLKMDGWPYFDVMFGSFKDGVYTIEKSAKLDYGPDQYAGQVFKDHKGRCILITWIPSWKYAGFAEKDVGCMSVPREIFMKDGKIYGYPVKEVQHLLKDSDPAVKLTDNGFMIERTDRESVVHNGEVNDLKIIRDEYILEVFVNGGECIYSVLL
ncbi:MAG: glycoside hydrolase family 32 protein [Clostridia bacterium]|nr:glycoside hydrolase family 32 protein [Clostridia bacterium]